MKYLVDVKDTSYATVEVEAKSAEEAKLLAEIAYYEGTVEWQDCEVDYEARPLKRERDDAR